VEKHELSKIDFELIDNAFKALLQSDPHWKLASSSIVHATPLGTWCGRHGRRHASV
jgi:hypothetical protein